MSMLSSYTLLSPAPGKSSPAALLQLRKQPAAASSSVVAVPWGWAPYKVSRASRLACSKENIPYDILPTGLVHPSLGDHGDWKITEDKDRIILEFNVGDKAKESEMEVATTKDVDQALLLIRYKGDRSDINNPLDVRLLMPPGYDGDNVMKAEILSNGWLQIIITKPPKQVPTTTQVTKQKKSDKPN